MKRTFIHAGKYKVVGNDAGPLSDEDVDYLSEGVDYVYSLFIDAVAEHRGVSVDTALTDMADGRMFIGEQAVDAGLVDEIGNFETALETARSMAGKQRIFGVNRGASAPKKKEGKMPDKKKTEVRAPITIEALEAEAPDLLEQIRAEGVASVDVESERTAGGLEERERILGLAGVRFGEEVAGKFQAIVESGVTVEQFTAVTNVDALADKSADKMSEMLDELKKAGAENPGAGAAASGPGNFTEAWQAIKEERGCSTEEAMKRAVKGYPKLHESFLKPQAPAGNA